MGSTITHSDGNIYLRNTSYERLMSAHHHIDNLLNEMRLSRPFVPTKLCKFEDAEGGCRKPGCKFKHKKINSNSISFKSMVNGKNLKQRRERNMLNINDSSKNENYSSSDDDNNDDINDEKKPYNKRSYKRYSCVQNSLPATQQCDDDIICWPKSFQLLKRSK